ncbi:MAG: peptidase S41 [bacterium]|nr:peptidase S41 [bacterium]
MSQRLPRILVLNACILLLAAGLAGAQTKLLRFPDIHGDHVAFCYAGDLWLASAAGGTATRLTAHPGLELFPRFSPDGKWIAFTGQYDGDEQVYVIPTTGGVPRQLTFYPARGPLPPRWGYDNQVLDWSPDGKAILFRGLRTGWDLTHGKLYLVPVGGGLAKPLPMPESGGGDLSPDGKRAVYSPLARDFRSWKRYQGGWAQELYLFDLATNEIERMTDHPRADRDPMWIGEKIYFSSDRDGTLNLYAYDVQSKQIEQLTHSDPWDVRWPNDDGDGRIVYERNGELQVFDVGRGQSQAISIFVPDDGLAARPARISAAAQIEGFALSPKGERALFVARGDVFTTPIENGPTRNLTRSSGAHDRWASWSPDGSRIAFISDRTGEEEIYLIAQDGRGEPQQLTDDGHAMRYAPRWSPDGKRLAFSDKNGRLWVLEVKSRELTLAADEARGAIPDYAWSPHGGHLVFSMSDPSGFRSIYIWSVADQQLRRITSELFNEFWPAWDPEGDYLYYLSDREFAPQIGSLEFNYAVDRETEIFALALRQDVAHPFPPESDEVTLGEEEDKAAGDDDEAAKDKGKKKSKKGKKGDDETAKQAPDYLKIDFEGLARRVARVPVEADNYTRLSAAPGHLLYGRMTPFYYGRPADLQPALHLFSFEDRKVTPLADDVGGYALSSDGGKVLVRHRSGFKLYDTSPAGKDSAKDVATSTLAVDRVPAEEWEEIFNEVWRRFRDFFYVDNMHGYDWVALGEQYRPLLEHVAHRSDLTYVIGEMIAELNVGHAYIEGGDYEIPARPQVALPGAVFELDEAAKRYRIAKIFQGQNEEERYRAPLTEIGVDVREGEYLLAVDGEELGADDNPYRLLRHKADRPVELTVNGEPTLEGARRVTFQPLTSEVSLRYLDMVDRNRKKVDEMTEGRVGYLHIPDMADDGIREFIKYFYPQIRKQGLVIDVRNNGGGNVSEMVIERLRRELLGTGFARNADTAGTYPQVVFHGHLVCLLDEDSASDGDIFPYMFREAGLGPLIGKRSWGGVVGINGREPLIDGGAVFVPEFSSNAVDGSWVIEGHGVDPDIEIENDPKSILEGRDPQLERGVEEVMKMIRENPKKLPEQPAAPVKTK